MMDPEVGLGSSRNGKPPSTRPMFKKNSISGFETSSRTSHSFYDSSSDVSSKADLPDVEISALSSPYGVLTSISKSLVSSNSSGSAFSDEKQAEGDETAEKPQINYEESPLFQAFLPLLRSLCMLGMLHRRNTPQKGSVCAKPTASQVYCWIVTLIAWAFVLKAAVAIRLVSGLGPYLLSTLAVIVYFVLCALNATSFLRAAHNPKSIRKFFTGFVKMKKYGGAFICPYKTKKYIVHGTTITWILTIVNHGIVGYMMFATSFFDVIVTDPFDKTQTTAIMTVRVIYYIVFFYINALWMFPSPLQLSCALVIYKEFGLFCDHLRKNMTKDKRFTGNLELERRRFQKMTKIIEAVDNGLSIHQAASFVCDIACICLLLYIILYYPEFVSTPVVMGGFIFWFIYAAADIVVVILSGVLINNAVI
jgi:hypothetical protein